MLRRTVKYIPCTEAFATGRLIRVWRPVRRIDKGLGTVGARSDRECRACDVAIERQLVALLGIENLVVHFIGAR